MTEQIEQQVDTSHGLIGKVVSNKMDKTIVVLVERLVQHPLYKKYVRRSTKLFAHDANNTCHEGDVVRIKQGPPRSKKKSWELVDVLEKVKN